MLTFEVIIVTRRFFLLLLALLFFFASELNLCCQVSVDGEWDGRRYSLADARRAELAAHAAAEEICPRAARIPRIEQRCLLSFRPPDGESRDLSARILAQVSGVSPLYAVRAGERSFGTVADRERLEERLRAALYASMPAGAVRACYAEGIEILPVYGRSGSAMSVRDMAMLVSELVPALYTDRNGTEICG